MARSLRVGRPKPPSAAGPPGRLATGYCSRGTNPPIERKHDRASPEQIGEGDRVSPYVRQPEIGSTSLNPDGRPESEAGPKLLDLGLVEGGPPRRSRAQEFRLEVSKLLIQPRSGILPGCLASRTAGPGGLKPCPGIVF